jgi:hypothetical protein
LQGLDLSRRTPLPARLVQMLQSPDELHVAIKIDNNSRLLSSELVDHCWRVSQYQSGETSPKAGLMDRTISGLLGIHFSMSVIA